MAYSCTILEMVLHFFGFELVPPVFTLTIDGAIASWPGKRLAVLAGFGLGN